MTRPLIIIFGSSRTQDPRHLQEAEQLGRRLAESGYRVGSGGYRAVMDAVSKGAHEAGGHVIGYLNAAFVDVAPSRWLDERRSNPDLLLRMRQMLQEGDGFVATWGGIGTLSEVTTAWSLGQVSADQVAPAKPLVLLGDHWQPLVRDIGAYTEIGSQLLTYPTLVDSVEEVVAYLRETVPPA